MGQNNEAELAELLQELLDQLPQHGFPTPFGAVAGEEILPADVPIRELVA